MRGVANSIIWNWNLLPNYSSGTTSLWLSGMQPAVYSYLAFSLIEAIAKFDQALKSIR